ncbi:MAG: hypothetical protein LUI39_10060 [Lachnospiraceae bacterium]|nr:hypothetical protein [Lachnospiraceae bacterium]
MLDTELLTLYEDGTFDGAAAVSGSALDESAELIGDAAIVTDEERGSVLPLFLSPFRFSVFHSISDRHQH